MALCYAYNKVNCSQKCGFNLNETDGGKDAAELDIAKDDWVQLKAGVSFQEYVVCHNHVTCEVQTLEQMMNEKLISGMSEEEGEEEGEGGKSEPPATFLSEMEASNTQELHNEV
jgi:hypothetical protein